MINLSDILSSSCLLQFLELLIGLQRPLVTLQQLGILTRKHLSSLLIALQLPLQPSQCRNSELTAIGLTIGTTMTYRIVDGQGRHMFNALEGAVVVAFPLAGRRELISAALYFPSESVHETVAVVPSLERTTVAIPEASSLTVSETGNAALPLE